MDTSETAAVAPRSAVLMRCPTCGRIEEFDPTDQFQLAQLLFQRCCGELMIFVVPDHRSEDLPADRDDGR